jgi:PPK2 family polyphosphate:nucleotide phosphotransferase
VSTSDRWTEPVDHLLRVSAGFRIAAVDTSTAPGWHGSAKHAEAHLISRGATLSMLQERLFAEGRSGGTRSVLLVLQGMDTSGKGGIVRHVVGMVDPQGVQIRSFGVPTEEERAHPFLWRIENALPRPGHLGVFDRSHYEDVLVVRVHDLVSPAVWGERYDEINDFEARIVAGGTTIIKVALVISAKEQKKRLHQRLERPDKYWKYNPHDLDERLLWPHYVEAYQAVFDRTSTDVAPWYAVPADHKWYARLAVTELLTRAIKGLDLAWPPADFDVAAEMARLDAQQP